MVNVSESSPIVKEKNELFPNDKGWYDVEVLKKEIPENYDLILVDGPWGQIGRGGFIKNLNIFRTDVPIIIDDVQRKEEIELVKAVEERRDVRKVIYKTPRLRTEAVAKEFAILTPS